MEKGSLRLLILVLNWNNLEDTSATIASLLDQNYPGLEILLVDNASEVEISAELRKRFPQIYHINTEINLGYTGGNNAGIRWALANNFDVIVLANNDIIIDDPFLIQTIVDDFNQQPEELGIIGPVLMDFYDKTLVQEKGTTVFYNMGDPFQFNVYRKESTNGDLTYFDGVPGAFMAVRRSVFEKIGLLDEELFMYGDETDFCLRAWQNNIQVAIDQRLLVYHKGDLSSQSVSPNTLYYKTRNLYYLCQKHKNHLPNFYYFRKKYFRNFLASLVRRIRTEKIISKHSRAEIRGVYHAIIGKTGKLIN